MDLIQRLISKNVERYGIALQSFYFDGRDDIPAYTYTVGMTGLGLPELIVFGLPENIASPLLNQLFRDFKLGLRPRDPAEVDDILTVPLLLEVVNPGIAGVYAVHAETYYLNDAIQPSYRQIVWPDANGKYPFEIECDPAVKESQPYIGSSKEAQVFKLVSNGR